MAGSIPGAATCKNLSASPALGTTVTGQDYFANLECKHGKGKALTVLAQKLARAVYYMLTREQAFALQRFVTA